LIFSFFTLIAVKWQQTFLNITMSKAPSPLALYSTYGVLGSLMSFLCGRGPGVYADNVESILSEVFPSVMVICVFLTSYSVEDVMLCGIAKAGYMAKNYKDIPAQMPEEAFLAERVQVNQVEQLPSFITATLCFSVLVNGRLGACLAMIWAILRRFYASRYRNSVGIPLDKKGLSMYTVPCYFILNVMLMAVVVQGLRWMVHDS
jgi:uncharacterized MAPEG superfamily protein